MIEYLATGAGAGTAILGLQAIAQWWLGKRGADAEDRRIDNESVETAMAALKGTIEHMSNRCKQLDAELTRMGLQAALILTETSRFRILHGVPPAGTLDSYEELPPEVWERIERHIGFASPLRGAFRADPGVPADMAAKLDEIGKDEEK